MPNYRLHSFMNIFISSSDCAWRLVLAKTVIFSQLALKTVNKFQSVWSLWRTVFPVHVNRLKLRTRYDCYSVLSEECICSSVRIKNNMDTQVQIILNRRLGTVLKIHIGKILTVYIILFFERQFL